MTAQFQGQPLQVTFGDVDITGGTTRIDVVTTAGEEECNTWFSRAFPLTEVLELWPWGKRWYLPRHEFDVHVKPGITDRAEVGLECIGEQRYIQDDRIHARLLRFLWMRVRCPVARWAEGIRE